VLWTFIALIAFPDTLTNVPGDPVDLFRNAISSPPDVESFIAGERCLIKPEQLPNGLPADQKESILAAMQMWQYYQGSRAGSNYFLRAIESANSPDTVAKSGLIAGRAGDKAYQFSLNSISYAKGTNATTANVNNLFFLVRQFLNMGLAEIEPESVVWSGNQFRALNYDRVPRYGRLELSNGLPSRLLISIQKESPPIKIVEYTYPGQSTFPGGYPSAIRISGGDGPSVEIIVQSVQIAAQRLAEDFFSEAKFKGTNITHVNIFSNNVTLVSDKQGKMIKLPKNLVKGEAYPQLHSDFEKRLIVFGMFAVTSVGPLFIFGWWKTKNNKQQNNDK
jgi:hypothetical protein